MRVVLSGLPFSGKSTVFKALVGKDVQPKKGASGKLQLNIGTLEMRDARLDELARILGSEKITHPKLSLIDITHVAEVSGKGMDVTHIREFDMLALVLGCFSGADPLQKIKDIESELILGDMQVVQNRIERLNKENKGRSPKEHDPEMDTLRRCLECLEKEEFIRKLEFSREEERLFSGFQFLTRKPTLVIANLSEEQLSGDSNTALQQYVEQRGMKYFYICAKLEAEIEELPEEERPEFLKSMGLKGLSKDDFIERCFAAQESIIFFTVVGKEARAWPIARGAHVVAAAGSIHSDMERGFIRAEVINYKDFVACGSFAQAKEKGLLRLESKEYIVQDGDIINIKFSV